jgi:hypothetical protein
MKVTNILMGIAICGALADSASAERYFRSRATGNWNAYTSWEYSDNSGASYTNAPNPSPNPPAAGTNMPGAADKVIIDNFTVTVNISNAAGDNLEVMDDGILLIGFDTFAKLSLDGGSDTVHDIAGLVQVGCDISGHEADGMLAFVTVDDQWLQGIGSVQGVSPSSTIQIPNSKKLHNDMKIEGTLLFAPLSTSATLVNEENAILEANGTDVLEFQVDVQDVVAGGQQYRASAGTATLLFTTAPSASLRGDFVLTACSKMQFQQSVTTLGTFNSPAGRVELAAGKSFTYGSGPTTISTSQWFGSCP